MAQKGQSLSLVSRNLAGVILAAPWNLVPQRISTVKRPRVEESLWIASWFANVRETGFAEIDPSDIQQYRTSPKKTHCLPTILIRKEVAIRLVVLQVSCEKNFGAIAEGAIRNATRPWVPQEWHGAQEWLLLSMPPCQVTAWLMTASADPTGLLRKGGWQ
jgi:hypothetical protein